MATIEEGKVCRDDADCSEKQYCYLVSGQCVDYTQCNRYNRQEAQKRARHPSQCGPCLPGHTAEILGTGEMAQVCKKINTQEDFVEPIRMNGALVISLIVGALLCCVCAAIVGFVLKRRSSTRKENSRNQCKELCVVGPSAPPAESSPFIGLDDRMTIGPFNNNKNLKDKNRLVRGIPFNEPNWVRTNPNYEYNISNENLNISEQSHSAVQVATSDDNSNPWPEEQLTIEVATGSLVDYDVEQMDNTMNAVRVQRNNPSASNGSENNNNNNNNPSNSSTSESRDTHDNKERVRSNILITQNISMNVNVHNGDCQS